MNRKKLVQIIRERRTFLCVGLDPEISKLPPHLLDSRDPVFEFCKQIIDATRPHCVAYKPNLAFFEALGARGLQTFAKVVKYIGNQHFIIADAKRGDIGNTSRMYAEAFFQKMKCDAITIAPYMGEDSVRPFLEFKKGKWAIVLALTSNKGSADFQMTEQADTGEPLFEKVLRRTQQWGSSDNLMFVVGATHPDSFRRVRQICPKHFLLVPGIGAQGGDLEAIARLGLIRRDFGLLVNASRSILYASSGLDFAEAARFESEKLASQMAGLLDELMDG